MKKKDFNELKVKEVAKLAEMVKAKKQDLLTLSVKIKSGEEKNLKKAKNLKKEIAQLATLIREKELGEKEKKKNENI